MDKLFTDVHSKVNYYYVLYFWVLCWSGCGVIDVFLLTWNFGFHEQVGVTFNQCRTTTVSAFCMCFHDTRLFLKRTRSFSYLEALVLWGARLDQLFVWSKRKPTINWFLKYSLLNHAALLFFPASFIFTFSSWKVISSSDFTSFHVSLLSYTRPHTYTRQCTSNIDGLFVF